ncbi:MAG: apolipoprotein N-acyltransferase [Pirellulaceae bacterium]|jgi:apolipoprotein N-acyltransferase
MSRKKNDKKSPQKKRSPDPLPADSVDSLALVPWHRSTFWLGLFSSVLLYLASPPFGLAALAWVAPVGWLLLIQQEKLHGRRPYVWLWLLGFLHWAAILQGIRLAHPALAVGWLVLSAYLAIYMPLFVGVSRWGVHHFKMPVELVAPVVWVGLELARGYVVTGFSAALLAHTQVNWLSLIQIADIGGGYLVSFLIVFVAACFSNRRCLGRVPGVTWRRRFIGPLLGCGMLLATLVYGRAQFITADPSSGKVKVALLQESVKTRFEYNPKRAKATLNLYKTRARNAYNQHPDIDLIVWPESSFNGSPPDIIGPTEDASNESQLSTYQRTVIEEYRKVFNDHLHSVMAQIKQDRPESSPLPAFIVGTSTLQYSKESQNRFNSALYIDPDGAVSGRYFKIHRVMFGEYIPIVDSFPILYKMTPMPAGLTSGDAPQVFQRGGVNFYPSICFESTVPHLVRNHVSQLTREGTPPDVIVNITNDGWFWGSSILNLHFRCSVFRAIENRKAVLVAANTGISGWIDDNGRVRQRAKREEATTIYADVYPSRRSSIYQSIGDTPAGLCLLITFGLLLSGIRARYRRSPAN